MAGHVTGAQFSAEANLMASDKVWPAMAKAYESTKGDLAERLLAALEAAQAQGGDIRGKQSAAILVVSGTPTGRPWTDRTFDLRVEDSPDPLRELPPPGHPPARVPAHERRRRRGGEARRTTPRSASTAPRRPSPPTTTR